MAIDPCATYRRAVQEALPNTLIVADHFHVSRLGNKAVTDVRQRVVRETAGRRGRATDPIWAGRRRLLRAAEHLTPKASEAMITSLSENDPSGQILIAWVAKKELRALLATAKTGGQRHDVAHRLDLFCSWCAGPGADIGEVQRLGAVIAVCLVGCSTTAIPAPSTTLSSEATESRKQKATRPAVDLTHRPFECSSSPSLPKTI